MTQPPLLIGEIIRNGLIFDLKNWGKETMSGHDLMARVERLFALQSRFLRFES